MLTVCEEMADRDSELAEAHRRRCSNASVENQPHVTGFLASQTLALFLAVPTHHPPVVVRYVTLFFSSFFFRPRIDVVGKEENQ